MSPKSIRGVMQEFSKGELHSGSSTGPKVRSRKQAIAIALSEQRQQGKSVAPKRQQPHANLGKYLHPMKDTD